MLSRNGILFARRSVILIGDVILAKHSLVLAETMGCHVWKWFRGIWGMIISRIYHKMSKDVNFPENSVFGKFCSK